MVNLIIICLLFNAINGQSVISPTVSNSSGDYFIADETNNFQQKTLSCTSDTLCYIECDPDSSCAQTVIRCNNAASCNIICGSGSSNPPDYDDALMTCADLTIYTSPVATNLSCPRFYSCPGILSIYTDYTNYPSSTIELRCDAFDACDSIIVKDALTSSTNYNALNSDRIKVYCGRFSGGCDYAESLSSYPLMTASVTNASGEYYSDTGSLIDITCQGNKLCYIDCSNGGCYKANIDCGNAAICTINCGDDNGCDYMQITASGINEFNYLCPETSNCGWSDFSLTSISSINITCTDTNSCPGNNEYTHCIHCSL